MTPNDKFPKETLRQIETEATVFVKGLSIEHSKAHQKSGYIAGATAWAGWKVKYDELQLKYDAVSVMLDTGAQNYDELRSQAQAMADALEWIKTYGPVDKLTVKVIDKALKQFKDGKEVGNG